MKNERITKIRVTLLVSRGDRKKLSLLRKKLGVRSYEELTKRALREIWRQHDQEEFLKDLGQRIEAERRAWDAEEPAF